MSMNAKELLNTMKLRQEMQKEGTICPSSAIKALTTQLVEKLSQVDGAEKIGIKQSEKRSTQYIRMKTGEILVEIPD